MIKEYKKNETQYIKKCKYCKSKFLYENEDYYSDYSCGKRKIKCPYCREVNKIIFKITYKNEEQMQEDYKKELNILKTKYNDLQNNIIDELEKWLNEYYESNRKWYNTELSNHDRKYYEREYRNIEFMIVKFKKQLNKLKGDNE